MTRRTMVRLLVGALCVLLLVAGITIYAAESGEVVLLRTQGAGGQWRETRVWIIRSEGELWIESATPDRPFMADLDADLKVEIARGDTATPYWALVVHRDIAHEFIREEMRARYGWADWWIGLLFDNSRSVAIRLMPRDGA
ncbi:MAG TPA: hypothetical protein EYG16_11475 [Deltaproteobacteria bacterium]|nr:hypothetical protein [Candidatus Binatota bacterium]HIL14278.1 hypothetical protein [Deltaproteobacteria bacterium]